MSHPGSHSKLWNARRWWELCKAGLGPQSRPRGPCRWGPVEEAVVLMPMARGCQGPRRDPPMPCSPKAGNPDQTPARCSLGMVARAGSRAQIPGIGRTEASEGPAALLVQGLGSRYFRVTCGVSARRASGTKQGLLCLGEGMWPYTHHLLTHHSFIHSYSFIHIFTHLFIH